MHYTNNSRLFHQESNGVLISIINDKWQRGIGGLVLGDDKLVDAQVSGCQGGLSGCHPSCFRPGTVHYSPCEMPLYIARYCEHGELNNAAHHHTGPAAFTHSPEGEQLSEGGRGSVGIISYSCTPIRTDHASVSTSGPRDPASRAGECFLLGFLGLATSLASLRVSLPTEPLIKRGFV